MDFLQDEITAFINSGGAFGLSQEAAEAKYPDGWKQPLPYIRVVAQPRRD